MRTVAGHAPVAPRLHGMRDAWAANRSFVTCSDCFTQGSECLARIMYAAVQHHASLK